MPSGDQSRFVSPPFLWAVRHPRGAATVAAAIVLVVVAALIVALQPQPAITLGMSWGGGPNYYTNGMGYVEAGGTLTNSGGADGYAVVNWIIDQRVVQQVRYLVPAHQSFPISLLQFVGAEAIADSYLVLLSVQRA